MLKNRGKNENNNRQYLHREDTKQYERNDYKYNYR